MWEQIWNTVASSGIWAMLFVALFFVQIRDSKAREAKYQETVNSLAEKLAVVNEINQKLDVVWDEIKTSKPDKD